MLRLLFCRLLACLMLLPAPAVFADSLATAQQFLQNGLPRLALARVERDQPARTDAPDWAQWESLRLTLLSLLGQRDALLQRVALLPSNVPDDLRQKALGHAAWAHLERGEGAAARAQLARLLWRFPLSAENHRWARRLVIRSWLVEHRPDEAYRAMLRYQQDFSPLPREVATEFVEGLLAEGRALEALTWLKALDPAGATATALALATGLVPPDTARSRAQAALASQPQALTWLRVLADAAQRQGDAELHLDALERQVAAGQADRLGALWQAYLALGEATANRAQLLQGDDASWLAVAAGLLPGDALKARALYAYLAQSAAQPATRATARQRLFAGLLDAGRLETAVALLARSPWGGAAPDAEAGVRFAVRASEEVRQGHRLGWLAAARYAEHAGRFDLAADYAVQAALATDGGPMDGLAAQAMRMAVKNLERAGLGEDTLAFQQRMASLPASAGKPPTRAASQAAGKSAGKRRGP
ncbi:hypothetical protein [Thiobacter aerophilum]|uniref:Tetratricopeptide repeat protein n=1 Tax=Thiobacter aerophilum TaxID=3121275 RepID=A0ABV0EHJ3_9BURK